MNINIYALIRGFLNTWAAERDTQLKMLPRKGHTSNEYEISMIQLVLLREISDSLHTIENLLSRDSHGTT